ncbi:MAG TPA: ABC transporter ATP-binding protein [Verrucomicrobiae bacterium]
MSDPIIKVEGLGKKYLLKHQVGGRSRYVALRDVLAEKTKSIFQPKTGAQKALEEFWALKDVSFEIKQGDAVGIIGRNGAGKSTLLKLLSRISEPSTGRIRLGGRLASLLEVGTGFHPELTGRENIFLNGAILGMQRTEIKARFDEIVAFAEVEKFLDTPVKRYSSGMYMRLAFAVAAHLEPEILVVDEVLAVGDAAFQKKCLGKMQDVSKGGRTVLFVSHNMEAVARLCTSGIYLAKGQLQLQGPTREVIKAYTENAKQVASEIDLAPLPRRLEGTGAARLLWLRCMPGESPAWCYAYGAPVEFQIELEVLRPIEDPEVGYAIFSTIGTELVSTTTFQAQPIKQLLPGRYLVQVQIQNLALNPGTYYVSIGITMPGKNIDNIGEAVQIEIVPTDDSVRKGLYRIYAPFTPHTVFKLNPLPLSPNLETKSRP